VWIPTFTALAFADPEPVSDAPASGSTALVPSSFGVDEKVEMLWTYVAGPDGLDVGDELWLEDPIFHGQRWSKWGDLSPYAEDCGGVPGEPSWGLVTARSSVAALSVTRTNCGEGAGTCRKSIYERAATVVTVEAGRLEPGDQLTILSGNESDNPACGFETPDRAFQNVAWLSWERMGGGDWRALDPVSLSFEPGEPSVLAAFLPSIVRTGESARLRVAVLDDEGNPVPSTGPIVFDLGTLDGPATATLDGATFDAIVTPTEPGVFRPTVAWGGLVATANPMEVRDDPAERIYWGDLHAHHGHTWWDESGVPHDENVEYARDVVGLDVVAEAEKSLPTVIDGEALWAELAETCERETEDGAFLVLSGFEWIGTTEQNPYAGHSNVYYDACDGPIGTHDRKVIPDLAGLWEWVDAARADQGIDAVTIPHATQFTGHTFLPNDLQRSIEVFSGWGDSFSWEDGRDGSAAELLRTGTPVGFIASSDNHDGWMGNVWTIPLDGVPGAGLAAFVAPRLTRADVFEALASRHTYATTGPRIVVHLDATVDDATFVQGSEIVAPSAVLTGAVHGTAPISRVRLVAQRMDPAFTPEVLAEETDPGALDVEGIAATVDRAPAAYWLEVLQADGHQAVSSPIFLIADCARVPDGAFDPRAVCATVPPSGGCGCDTRGTNASPALFFSLLLLGVRRR
jgi:hypothetical protein